MFLKMENTHTHTLYLSLHTHTNKHTMEFECFYRKKPFNQEIRLIELV